MARGKQSSEQLIKLGRNGSSRVTVPATSQKQYCLPSSPAPQTGPRGIQALVQHRGPDCSNPAVPLAHQGTGRMISQSTESPSLTVCHRARSSPEAAYLPSWSSHLGDGGGTTGPGPAQARRLQTWGAVPVAYPPTGADGYNRTYGFSTD